MFTTSGDCTNPKHHAVGTFPEFKGSDDRMVWWNVFRCRWMRQDVKAYYVGWFLKCTSGEVRKEKAYHPGRCRTCKRSVLICCPETQVFRHVLALLVEVTLPNGPARGLSDWIVDTFRASSVADAMKESDVKNMFMVMKMLICA